MSEDEPKTAIEVAMEKLRARGDFQESKLTDAQRAEIAEIRSYYKAKIAELEIKQESKMKQVATLEELESLKEALAREKNQFNKQMEEKVQKVRRGEK